MNRPLSNDPALTPTDLFGHRHIGPNEESIHVMLTALGYDDLGALADAAIPARIRSQSDLQLGVPRSEHELLRDLRGIAQMNRLYRSYLGMGYNGCITPGVIQRNILENPGWYTQYTPYQAEIAQGRLEMLLNFQTMISDLTGFPVANASLLDEATAAAEAMTVCLRARSRKRSGNTFLVASDCHPQTIAVVQHRAEVIGIEVVVEDVANWTVTDEHFGCLVQYPATDGTIRDFSALCDDAHEVGCLVVVAADPLSLCLLTPPAEFGADLAIGSTQRFGVPMGYGGPHAAYFACRQEFVRKVPGRIIGVSVDSQGNPALRMAMQTREQHIRRDRATSNICTSQVLLAIMAGAYGLYHGPEGLRAIAHRVHMMAHGVRDALKDAGHRTLDGPIFDTIRVSPQGQSADEVITGALNRGINLRKMSDDSICIALDETVTGADLYDLFEIFGLEQGTVSNYVAKASSSLGSFTRTSEYMTHPNFHLYRSETEMLRYLRRLESRDLSLCQSMIPLGSCTMKLNGSSEMVPVSWPEFASLHPFVPLDQAKGYAELFRGLEQALCTITGFDAFSLQPNAGSQGEYAGLLVIRAYHRDRGDLNRTICLIPTSAHGTNPASAVMAGMKVVPVACDDEGNIDLVDLQQKAEKYSEDLGALMVTYPSTHGVFEESITQICDIVHEHGGQVYMDGANMNAQVGLCYPGSYGPDVCHLNLHKTFCIPHGGGGPGMGPIGVNEHLAPYLPGHPVVPMGGEKAIPAVSAAPWGSPGILPISWMYIFLMGAEGLTRSTLVAILNANYVAKRLEDSYPVLYQGTNGLVAHECIIDLRPLKEHTGITVDDVAKRLVDYGFHAPTMSWPVAGTMMIEPTESESLAELDRFCDAMIAIREEAEDIVRNVSDPDDNALKNAPHTAQMVTSDEWTHPYSRESAAYPAKWSRGSKFWPAVSRVDNAYGDRNLACTCPSMDEYQED